MSTALFRGAALYKRSKWRRELEESKIDMGLLPPYDQAAFDASLCAAVAENDYRAMQDMVKMGADPNMKIDAQDGMPAGTLLHFAVRKASLRTVIALLKLGADPFAVDAEGHTAREAAQSRLSGARMRTVLKLWERRRLAPQEDGTVLAFEALLRDAS